MRTRLGPTLAATRKASKTRWCEAHDDQFLNPQSEFFIEGPQKLSSLLRSSLWLWGWAMFFMIAATNTVTSEWVWAETASAPPDLSEIIQTDLEVVKEDLQFLQEETVSIAISHEQPISEAPSNVYVITAEDIRHSGATDIPTILRRIPGMEVIQMTGAHFDVSMRGDNQPRSNKLLVLVDGRSIYLDVQGEMLWKGIPVTLPEIKQIEVLKGPASALYGFNAFDGIINIITKSAEEMKGTTAQVGAGELGTISSSAIHAGYVEKLGYRLSAGWDQANNWDDQDSLDFRAYKFNGNFDYALNDLEKLNLSGGYLNSNKYNGPNVDTVQVSQKPSIGYANIGYERPNFFLRGWWTRQTQPAAINVNPDIAPFFTVLDSDGNTQNQSLKAHSWNIEAQHALEIGTTNRFTYGITYRHNRVSSNFLGTAGLPVATVPPFNTLPPLNIESKPRHENRIGLYIQDEWQLLPSLTVVGGMRFDMDTFINPTYSPRFSLVYRPSQDHSIRAGISVAYRPPTIFETFTLSQSTITVPIPFPPFTTQAKGVLFGSDTLVPEQIISYELGYQGWYLKHRLRVRTDLFYNHISDLISFGIIPGSSNTQSTFSNGGTPPGSPGGSADIYGGEVGVEFLVTPWLTGFANYAYQEIHQTYSSTSRVQRAGPRFKTNGGARLDFSNGLNGEAVLHYVGSVTYPIDPSFSSFFGPVFGTPAPEQRIGSYFLLNLRAGYRFWSDKAEVAVSAFNALNDKHKEHPLGENIGSRVMGWLTIRH